MSKTTKKVTKKSKPEVVQTKAQADVRRRNEKGQPTRRLIKRLGERLRKGRYLKPNELPRKVQIYTAVMELFEEGRVGLDDAIEALELIRQEIDDKMAEGMMSWQEESTQNWLGSTWGR